MSAYSEFPVTAQEMLGTVFAVFALNDCLVQRGLLGPSEVADTLRKLQAGSDAEMQAVIHNIAAGLEDGPFRQFIPGRALRVIDGGQGDAGT